MRKRLLSIWLALCMVLTLLPGTVFAAEVASGECGKDGDNVTWSLDDSGTLTISGTGEMKNYSASDSDYSPWYDYRDSIKVVHIEDGVTTIGKQAFHSCSSLMSITIPDNVTTIGDYSFYGCRSITSIAIPNSVISIGHFAFTGCTSLTSITIPDSVTSIESYAFDGCSKLTSITIPDSVISIGIYAFSNCGSLTSITIPNSVPSIGGWAFSGCTSLTSITIPDGMTNIESAVFRGCIGLTNIAIPNSVTSIGSGAFEGCTSLTSITIPDSVTSIGSSVFSGCTSLTSITIPDSVKTFEYGLFSGCSRLMSITIPDNVTSIEGAVFESCTSLTSITIPDSVTSIGALAFTGCGSLTSITIPDSVSSIGGIAFNGCTKLTDIHYSGTKTQWAGITVGDYNAPLASAIIHCSDGDIVPESASDIIASGECGAQGDNVLWTLNSAGTLTITGTGNMADYNQYAVTSAPWQEYRSSIKVVRIQDGVTRIGSWAFAECRDLMSVSVPDSITSIGSLAFWLCKSLTSLTLPDSINSIEYRAFDNCSAMTSVNIPRGMTKLENSLFADCTSLTSMTIPENTISIGQYVFSGCDKLKNVIIPDGLTNLERGAFSSCSSLESITIPEGVTSIGDWTFSGCSSLTNLVIPSRVTSIDANAVWGCISLKSVTIPVGITKIPDVFGGCYNLTDVYYSGTKAQWNEIPLGVSDAPLLAATIHCIDGDIVPEAEEYTYAITDFLGTFDPETGYYAVTADNPDATLIIDAPFAKFMDLYLDGIKLSRASGEGLSWGYKVREGSTIIDINGSMMNSLGYGYGVHTLVAEFMQDEQSNDTTRRVSQDFALWPSEPTIFPDGFVGVPYSYKFADSWEGPAWDAMPLPDGLKFENSGIVSGTPTKAGTWYFIISNNHEEHEIDYYGYGKLTIKASAEAEVTRLPEGVKYVPYDYQVDFGSSPYIPSYGLVGTLPSGLTLDPEAGKISGIPQANGTFSFGVLCSLTTEDGRYHGSTMLQRYTVTIQSNTDSAVQQPNDYEITTPIGTVDPQNPNHFLKYDYTDEELIINGPYNEFMDLYLDGRKLTRDVDYTAREGSTVITVRGEIFRQAGTGTHTIAAEFRSGGSSGGTLKRVSQNYTLSISSSGGSSGGGKSSSTPNWAKKKTETKSEGTQPAQPELPFTDVKESDWFYEDLKWAYEQGLISGYADGTFKAQRSISQATIVTVLARMAKVDLNNFTDVQEPGIESGRQFTESAIWARRSGLLPDGGEFTGDATTTRNQMAVMLVKYLQSMGKNVTPPENPVVFADEAEMSAEGITAFQVLHRDGIFRGTGGLKMNPAGSTTRAHFVALIHRVYETAMKED